MKHFCHLQQTFPTSLTLSLPNRWHESGRNPWKSTLIYSPRITTLRPYHFFHRITVIQVGNSLDPSAIHSRNHIHSHRYSASVRYCRKLKVIVGCDCVKKAKNFAFFDRTKPLSLLSTVCSIHPCAYLPTVGQSVGEIITPMSVWLTGAAEKLPRPIKWIRPSWANIVTMVVGFPPSIPCKQAERHSHPSPPSHRPAAVQQFPFAAASERQPVGYRQEQPHIYLNI